MPARTNIQDPRNKARAYVDSTSGEEHALVVATRDLKTFNLHQEFLTDINGVTEMNVNGAVGGTPELIHDGIDLVKWTADSTKGVWDFESATHAFEGIITVVDYSAIDAGDAFTINAVTRTEGTDWDAETSNAVTADNIRDDINANVTGFTALTGSDATVIVVADPTYDITTFSTNADVGEMLATGKSIDGTAAGRDGLANFTRASSLSTTNYVLVTVYIYITAYKAGKHIEIKAKNAGVDVGNKVNLDDYFDTNSLNVWQIASIPLSDMDLVSKTIDYFELKNKDAAVKFYIDKFQLEQTSGGANVIYDASPAVGKWLYITELQASFADAIAGTVSDGTMPGLSYNKLLNETLSNGFLLRIIKNGAVVQSRLIRTISDTLQYPNAEIQSNISDGTNTFISIRQEFPVPMILKYEEKDIITVTIRDDMTGLLFFKLSINGYTEDRS